MDLCSSACLSFYFSAQNLLINHKIQECCIYGRLTDAHQRHTHPFNGPFPGLPGWASTRKVKLIWILLKQETVSGSDISKSAPRSRQITTPAPHRSVFYKPDALPAAQPTASKHRRHQRQCKQNSTSTSTNNKSLGYKSF